MGEDFRAFSFSRGCWTGDFGQGVSGSIDLDGSVGLGGQNKTGNVSAVQRLLNNVPLTQGAPQPLLVVDDKAGPLTIAAISRFQRKHFGRSDGRIDPGGQTITKLESLNSSGQMVLMVRRILVMNAFADTERALHKTLLELDNVAGLEFLKHATKVLFPGRRASQILNRHFAMESLSANSARSSLQFIRQTFANMRAILTRPPSSPGNPWGANIVEADPRVVPFTENMDAYVPLHKGNPQRFKKLGISPGRIYFTSRMDGKTPDYFLMTLLHELAHFANEQIGDKAYANLNTYLYQHLPHNLRLFNADCYALLAFEYFAGQDRMKVVCPHFPLEIYEDLT